MAAPQVTTEAPTLIGKDFVTFNAVLASTGGKACVGRFWYTHQRIRGWSASPWQSLGGDGSSFDYAYSTPTPKGQHEYWAEVANEDGGDTGLTLPFWFRWKQPPYDGSPFFPYNYQAVGPYENWTISCRTDICCHMTMWFDNGVPYRKIGEHFKRGKVFLHTPLIYFRPKWGVVQDEPGDSTTHTFQWQCKKPYGKYYHQATATVDGRLSPSKSPFYRLSCKPTPPPVETSDQCTSPTNLLGWAQWWNAVSQSFSPDHDYKLNGFDLRICQYQTTRKGPLRLYVTKVGGSCWSEQVLWMKDIYSTSLPAPGSQAWTHFSTGAVALTSGSAYRLLIVCQPGWVYLSRDQWKPGDHYMGVRWWANSNPDCYPRGTHWYNCNFRDSGGSWRDTNMDMNFVCWEQPG
ncbi:hypothetical protein ES708_15983 [subsurface metagenome]